jgi:peptide/nickel transport system substrate-binding protein
MLFDFTLTNSQCFLNATEKEYLTVPVRQALITALDRQGIVDTLTFGYARLPAPSVMMHPSLFPNENLPEYPYDVERAKQLLEEGGWDPNRVLKFAQFIAEGQPSNIVAAVMSMWEQAGIKSEFTPLDPATQVETGRSEDHPYDVVFSGLAWLAYEPFSTYAYFACENRPLYSNYCNPAYDEIMQEAVRTLDPDDSKALYQEAQVIVQTDLPYTPLWQEPVTWAFSPRIHGGNLARGPLNDISSELWWKE